jgi:Zn-dependent protease with chaperone function
MGIANFFNSSVGMYIAQAFCHSLVAAIIVDRALQTWKIVNPLIKQRFRLIVIILPIFSYPAYQIFYPERSSASFRIEAFFDINRWLTLELWGKFPVTILFIALLSITTVVFLIQEMIPVLRHTAETRTSPEVEESARGDDAVVRKAMEPLPVDPPEIVVLEDEEVLLFSTTGKNPAIFLSSGLIKRLTTEEMQTAIAHEIAHIMRNKRPLLIIVFLLRILMFFNPVVLLEFRRTVQEEEKICDDIAVSLTRNPHALAETLKKLYYSPHVLDLKKAGNLSNAKEMLEEYSHNTHIAKRIERLEKGPSQKNDGEWITFGLTLGVIIIINYFVV